MNLEDYRPISKLITKTTVIQKPRFPVIDAHNHLGIELGGGWINKPISELIDILDEAGIIYYIDLDGGWGEDILNAHLQTLKNYIPNRFQVFGGVDWSMWQTLGNSFPEWAASRLRTQADKGATGLKVWKNFGLHVRDGNGNLVRVNDRRLDSIWQTAAELKFPVMIHVADPVAFFDAKDQNNERWEELEANPSWHFPSPAFPRFHEIIDDFGSLVSRHPQTTFIGAHVGSYAEDLQWVGEIMNKCPNFFVDISARVSELGRQPYSAKKFFNNYSDRILFGSDCGPDLEIYHIMYRFLETKDEYFNYSTTEIPQQGRWYIYGIGLEDSILKKIYYENAQRILVSAKKL